MDFDIPPELQDTIATMDAFIEAEIKPLEDAHPQYFDHRREHARTDWDNGGVPTKAWEELLGEMRRRADKAGFYRMGLPKRLGGRDASNLAQAVLREHLAAKGVGLHADLQSETSVSAASRWPRCSTATPTRNSRPNTWKASSPAKSAWPSA